MNEIVNQHNDLIDLPLRKFNSSEIDILHAICYKCQNGGTKEVVLPFYKIRQLAHYQAKDDSRFYKDIESMGDKLFSLHLKIGTEREYTKFVLFPIYKVSEESQTLTVAVNEKFTYLLNELSGGNYTALELQQSAKLHSAYAKAIYKKLRQWRDKGKWIVTLEDFRNYLDIPKSYKTGHIHERVITPSIKELSLYFENLSCEPYHDESKKGRGRPAIAGYNFTFKKQPQKKAKKKPTIQQIADKTNWEKLGKYCPACHKEVWKKHEENEHGEYWIIGHPDFKTGGCDWTSNNFGDALSKEALERIEQETGDLTPEQEENKETIKSFIGKLFGK